MYVKYRVLLNKETWESKSMANQLTIAIALISVFKMELMVMMMMLQSNVYEAHAFYGENDTTVVKY